MTGLPGTDAQLGEDKALVTRVILIRHGESRYNVERRVQGHCDESTLTEAGRVAARQVAAALRSLTLNAVYTSPLRRARETAELILTSLTEGAYPTSELFVTEHLKEISLPLWEGLLFRDVQSKFPEEYRCWRERPHQLCMRIPSNNGSVDYFPVPDLFERARQFWQELLPRHPGETILLIAHSGINRALISTAIGISPERYQYLRLSNCSISVLNFADNHESSAQLESFNLTAHLGLKLPKLKSGHRGPRLLLVRHGETEWNRQKRFQGQIDVPLNAMGEEQARQVADFLQGVSLQFAASSPLARPKVTAEAILEHHPEVSLSLYEDLREISHGLWEGKLDAEVERAYPGMLEQWKSTPETVQMPEGENLQQVWDRAIAAWNAIVASAADANPGIGVVSAHDAINKAILCQLLGLEPACFWRFKQGNGAISIIDYPNGPTGHPILQAMNITTHLSEGILDQTTAGAL